MESKEENKEEKNRTIKGLKFILLLIIIFSLFAPWLLTQFSILDLTQTGQIGDTLGGIMNPFIALGGIIVTYLAFKMQYEANQNQIKQFNLQLKEEQEKFKQELTLQKNQFAKTQFENQFYEMLRIHRENVNDLVYTKRYFRSSKMKGINKKYNTINGIKTFSFLLNEYMFYVELTQIESNKIDIKEQIRKSYNLFWNENGNSNQLAHYYRQLFQTVKFTVSQEILTYEEKRNYLRILRSQLSNEEQVLLFYNWFSGFGSQWEDDKNSFFVDYRMIHNISPKMLIEEIDLDNLFKGKDFKKEKNRENDPIFEFEEW